MPSYEEIKFVPRGRGTVLCLGDKDYYRQTNYTNAQSLWRCSYYLKNKCVGSLKISMEEKKILKYKEHNDDCNNNKRVQACRGEDTVPAVYKKVVSSFSNEDDDFVSEIPSFQQIKSTVYRRRNDHFKVSKTCDSDVQTLQIPSQYSDFVLADYNDRDGRIIIFSSKEQTKALKDIKTVLCDGTFEVCPEPFEQLYSLHGDLGSSEEFTNIAPLLYILLTKKTKKTYVKMFEMIKSVLPMFDPSEIISDFERAFTAAVRKVFPNAKHHGCYFHYTRAVQKYADTLKLTKDDIFLQRIVSLCTALPLLPENMLKDGFSYIQSEAVPYIENDKLKLFFKYMDSFWMRKEFMKTWCCFGVKHRTTNSVESWHHAIRGSFKRTPPKFLTFLVKISVDADFQKIKIKNKKNVKRQKKFIARDHYIQENQLQLIVNDISVEQFLNRIIYLKKH